MVAMGYCHGVVVDGVWWLLVDWREEGKEMREERVRERVFERARET